MYPCAPSPYLLFTTHYALDKSTHLMPSRTHGVRVNWTNRCRVGTVRWSVRPQRSVSRPATYLARPARSCPPPPHPGPRSECRAPAPGTCWCSWCRWCHWCHDRWCWCRPAPVDAGAGHSAAGCCCCCCCCCCCHCCCYCCDCSGLEVGHGRDWSVEDADGFQRSLLHLSCLSQFRHLCHQLLCDCRQSSRTPPIFTSDTRPVKVTKVTHGIVWLIQIHLNYFWNAQSMSWSWRKGGTWCMVKEDQFGIRRWCGQQRMFISFDEGHYHIRSPMHHGVNLARHSTSKVRLGIQMFFHTSSIPMLCCHALHAVKSLVYSRHVCLVFSCQHISYYSLHFT